MNIQSVTQFLKGRFEGVNKRVFNLRVGQRLAERVELLRDQTKRQKYDLKNMKREYDLYALKHSGLQEIEKKFF